MKQEAVALGRQPLRLGQTLPFTAITPVVAGEFRHPEGVAGRVDGPGPGRRAVPVSVEHRGPEWRSGHYMGVARKFVGCITATG